MPKTFFIVTSYGIPEHLCPDMETAAAYAREIKEQDKFAPVEIYEKGVSY